MVKIHVSRGKTSTRTAKLPDFYGAGGDLRGAVNGFYSAGGNLEGTVDGFIGAGGDLRGAVNGFYSAGGNLEGTVDGFIGAGGDLQGAVNGFTLAGGSFGSANRNSEDTATNPLTKEHFAGMRNKKINLYFRNGFKKYTKL